MAPALRLAPIHPTNLIQRNLNPRHTCHEITEKSSKIVPLGAPFFLQTLRPFPPRRTRERPPSRRLCHPPGSPNLSGRTIPSQKPRPFENREGAASRKIKTVSKVCHPPMKKYGWDTCPIKYLTQKVEYNFCVMQSSIVSRLFDRAFLGMRKSVIEQRVALVLALLAIPVNYARHKLSMQALRDNAWDTLLPWILLLCLFFAWHVLKAAVSVYKDEQQIPASPIILTDRHRELIIPPPKFRLNLYGSACLLLAIPILFSYLVWLRATESVQVAPPGPQPIIAVFAKCDSTALSFGIPPHDAIRIVPVNEKGMRSVNWGSYEIANNTDKPMQWPDKDKFLQARKQHDTGGFGYRCEISNHGEVNLIDVAMPMRFWFGGKGGEENAVKYTPIISPLDVGKAFVLYFVNDCPVYSSAVLPDYATVLVVGETTRRNTKLNLPHRNPVDPIMMWFPTKIRWIGSTQCE